MNTISMHKYRVIEKAVGQTPLMAIEAWKGDHPSYAFLPISYAGRLDPMASGKLLLLLGEECKRQKEYTKLDKEYEIEVLFDVGSDTGDALGLVRHAGKKTPVDNFSRIDEILKAEEGSQVRQYPPFSSKTVRGKPLFLYALEGTLATIEIPTHVENIYRATFRGMTSLSRSQLARRVEDFLTRVPYSDEASKQLGANFRIEEVRSAWEKVLKDGGERQFVIASFRVACSSGAYMRALAPRLGQALGTEALAFSIKRTAIGRYWWRWWVHRL